MPHTNHPHKAHHKQHHHDSAAHQLHHIDEAASHALEHLKKGEVDIAKDIIAHLISSAEALEAHVEHL